MGADHRNAGGWYRAGTGGTDGRPGTDIEVVTTSAVGTHLIATPNTDFLNLGGFSFPEELSTATSGFRLVAVDEQCVGHKFFALDDMPNVLASGGGLAVTAKEWAADEHPVTVNDARPRL